MSEKDSYIKIDFEAWDKFLEEFQHESDRAAAILAGGYLDDQLANILGNFLINDNTTQKILLENGNAPLHSFYSRILCSYSLGLIDEDECKDLNTIRDIRNDFAHKPAGLSFSDQSISDKCKNFIKLKQIEEQLLKLDMDDPRNRFNYETVGLTFLLNMRIGKSQSRCSPANKNYLQLSDKPFYFNK